MKKIISSLLILGLVVGVISLTPINVKGESNKKISILFTNDIHSHVDSKEENRDGRKDVVGGFAKIAAIKKDFEKKDPYIFLLDGGNFSMGTAFQAIYKSHAPELSLMSDIGYDVAALGGSEFDYGLLPLAQMIRNGAKVDGDKKVLLLEPNINWKENLNNSEIKKASKYLKKSFERSKSEEYAIIEKGKNKIAVFSIMSSENIKNKQLKSFAFKDYVNRAQNIVEEILQNKEADFIVCLSQIGFDEEEAKEFAKKVPEINLIINGNSHVALREPIKEGTTYVVSAGKYNRNIGHITLNKTQGIYEVNSYKLMPLDRSIKEDSPTSKIVDDYKINIDRRLFYPYNLSYNKKLAYSKKAFDTLEDMRGENENGNLGSLIADGYRYIVNSESKHKRNADIAFLSLANIDGTIDRGHITTADAFEIASVGIGKDGKPGYPLVEFFLEGKEIKDLAEIDATISKKNSNGILYFSGLKYSINEKRIPMNRAFDIRLTKPNGTEEKIDNDKLYKVVTNIYGVEIINNLISESHGLLSFEPKNYKGKVISNIDSAITVDEKGKEIKAWYAIARYLSTFNNTGLPNAYYGQQQRKYIDHSLNPIHLIKEPNKVGLMAAGLLMIPIVIIVGILIFFKKRKYQRRGYTRSMFSGGRNSKRQSYSRYKKPGGGNSTLGLSRVKKRKRRRF